MERYNTVASATSIVANYGNALAGKDKTDTLYKGVKVSQVVGDYHVFDMVDASTWRPKTQSLRSFFLKMKYEEITQSLLNLCAELTAYACNFALLGDEEVIANLLITRRELFKVVSSLTEDKLLNSMFKSAFRQDINKLKKAYYKSCRKTHRQRIEEYIPQLFAFDVKQNAIVKL